MCSRVIGVASRSVVLGVFVGVLLLTPTSVLAATCTWTGLGANNNWTTAANWGAGCGVAGPVNNDAVVFPAGAQRPAPTNNTAGLILSTLTISGTAAGDVQYTIGGSGLSIVGGITIGAQGPFQGQGPSISAPLTLGGSITIARTNTGTASVAAINLNGYQLTFDTIANGRVFLDGVVSGSGLLRKTGIGQIAMNAANTFTGNFQILAGAVTLENANGLGASGPGNGTFVSTGATLSLFTPNGSVVSESMTLSGDGYQTFGALYVLGGTIEVSGDILLVGFTSVRIANATGNLVLNGNISGGASILAKQGSGRLTLRGNNSFPLLQFDEGSVFITGNQPTVETAMAVSATLLGGTGTTGRTSVGVGRIAPGVSPGIINTGNFSLGQVATYEVELAGPTAGTGYDQINVTGPVTIAGNLTGTVTFAPAAGTAFTILNNDGGDAVVGTFNGLAEGAAFQFGGLPFRITYAGGTGNDIVITYSPLIIVPTMPWPMLVFLALMLAGLVFMRLRRTPQGSLHV